MGFPATTLSKLWKNACRRFVVTVNSFETKASSLSHLGSRLSKPVLCRKIVILDTIFWPCKSSTTYTASRIHRSPIISWPSQLAQYSIHLQSSANSTLILFIVLCTSQLTFRPCFAHSERATAKLVRRFSRALSSRHNSWWSYNHFSKLDHSAPRSRHHLFSGSPY